MATLNIPTSVGFRAVRFGLKPNTRTFRSPLTQSVQTLELAGALWLATYELPPIRDDKAGAAEWQAFLVELMGESGRFFGFDPKRKTPRGSNLGTPLVDGAAQTGKSLTTKGWTATQTGLLLPADYFEVNGEYKMVTASVDSDGGGLATINFVPPLRASPPDSDPIVTVNPKVTMKLINDDQSFWNEDVITYGMVFSAAESFV